MVPSGNCGGMVPMGKGLTVRNRCTTGNALKQRFGSYLRRRLCSAISALISAGWAMKKGLPALPTGIILILKDSNEDWVHRLRILYNVAMYGADTGCRPNVM